VNTESPCIMIVHRPYLRSSSTEKNADSRCIMSRLEMLIDVRRLKSIELAEQPHRQTEATMLILRLLRFVVHDPVPSVLYLINIGRTLASAFVEA
jgi:hypothetical protein